MATSHIRLSECIVLGSQPFGKLYIYVYIYIVHVVLTHNGLTLFEFFSPFVLRFIHLSIHSIFIYLFKKSNWCENLCIHLSTYPFYFNSLYHRASKHGLLSQVKKRFCFFWIYYINIQQSLFANQLCHHMVKNYGKVKFFVREFLSSFNWWVISCCYIMIPISC